MRIGVNNAQQVPRSFLRLVSYLWYIFYLSFFGSIIEAAGFENEFFRGKNVTPKKEIN
jgi:hypothetical protein